MKKLLIVVLLAAAVIGISGFSTYAVRRDQMASRRQEVDHAWSKVNALIQRRADLVPAVVASMKNMAARNREVIAAVERASSDVRAADKPVETIAASRRLESAVARLFAAAQDDPDLLVNRRFFVVQEQWAMASNRIAPERVHYDQAVQDYNAFISRFPNDMFARWASFRPMENYFTADADASARRTAALIGN